FGWPIYRLHQDLIGLRRRHPWLHRARIRTVELRNADLVFEAAHDGHRLFVALSLSDATVARMIPSVVGRLAGEVSVTRVRSGSEITVPAHGWGILEPLDG